MDPAPNAAGWTRTDSVSFTFAGVSTDSDDADPIGLECRLEGPGQDGEWHECSSPQSYQDLADTEDAQRYTFSVRAFDEADRAIDYDDPSTPFDNEPEVEDEDATPSSMTWRQDTVTPVMVLAGGPYDAEGTGWPVADRRSVRYLLDASEDKLDYRCQLDAQDVSCDEGEVALRRVAGGDHFFSVQATDRAGNTSHSVMRQFVMPHDLRRTPGWKQVRGKAFFGRDLLKTSTKGARVKFKARNVRRMVMIAPSASSLGKVRIRVGNGIWHTVHLGRKKPRAQRHYVIRGPGAPLVSGTIVIEALGRAKVDALYFPPV